MSSMTTVETRYGMSSRLGYTGDPVFEELENGYGYVCRKADHKMIKLNPLTFFIYKLCGLPVRTAVKAFIRELRTKGIQEDDQTLTDHFFAAVAVLTERGLVNVSGENDEDLSVDYSALNIRIVNAYLEITSLCNAHCPYCYNNSGCGGAHMESEVLKDLCEQVVDLKATNVILSGGEPTLHPDFFRTVAFFKEKGLHTSVITNAWFGGNEKYIEALQGCDVQFTLDHIQPEMHDAIKGKGSYSAVKAAMLALANSKNPGMRKLRINLSYENEQDIEAFIRTAEEFRASVVDFHLLQRLGRDKDYGSHIDYDRNPEQAERIVKKLQQLSREAAEKGGPAITYKGCLPTHSCNFLNIRDNTFNCLLRVTPAGEVFPCQFFSAPYFALGNIHDRKLKDIIHSGNLCDLIEILNGRAAHNASCNSCVWNGKCRKGCPAKAYTLYNTIWQKSGECDMWKHLEYTRLENKAKEQ